MLTGAGISTESGIPDFRSPGGLWAEFDPQDYASLESFRRDPARIWDFYGRRFAFLAEAEPNDAHRAVARLEQLGLVEAVVTQNIDLLHERAGSRGRDRDPRLDPARRLPRLRPRGDAGGGARAARGRPRLRAAPAATPC